PETRVDTVLTSTDLSRPARLFCTQARLCRVYFECVLSQDRRRDGQGNRGGGEGRVVPTLPHTPRDASCRSAPFSSFLFCSWPSLLSPRMRRRRRSSWSPWTAGAFPAGS